jgi:hypothetical protein
MACFLKVLAWLLVVLLFLHYSLRLAAVAASVNFLAFLVVPVYCFIPSLLSQFCLHSLAWACFGAAGCGRVQ